MSDLVAVYGTLKQGHYNNSAFPKGSKMIAVGTTYPEFTMIDLGSFPGVVRVGETEVEVEIWEVSDMTSLDRLEGNGHFYTREVCHISVEGEDIAVWIYTLPLSYIKEDNIIEEGVW